MKAFIQQLGSSALYVGGFFLPFTFLAAHIFLEAATEKFRIFFSFTTF